MIAGAILLVGASILFCKHVDYVDRIPERMNHGAGIVVPGKGDRSEPYLVMVPTIIMTAAGVILLGLGWREKSGGQPKG